jgi:hypothetical protein
MRTTTDTNRRQRTPFAPHRVLPPLTLSVALLASAACAGSNPTGPGLPPAAAARAQFGAKPTGTTGDVTVQGGGISGGVDPITAQGRNSTLGGGLGDVTAYGSGNASGGGIEPAVALGRHDGIVEHITTQGGGGMSGDGVDAITTPGKLGGSVENSTPQGRPPAVTDRRANPRAAGGVVLSWRGAHPIPPSGPWRGIHRLSRGKGEVTP